MARFTFIMEFAGGTYVAQADGESVEAAASTWVNSLRFRDIEGLSAENYSILVRQVKDYQPVVLSGVKEVWCITLLLDDRLVLVNCVRTAEP
jgi:hypothetical protein